MSFWNSTAGPVPLRYISASTRPSTLSRLNTVLVAEARQVPLMKGEAAPHTMSASTKATASGRCWVASQVAAWSNKIVDLPAISTGRKNITRPRVL